MIRDSALLFGLTLRLAWNGFRNRPPSRMALYALAVLGIGVPIGFVAATVGFVAGRILMRFPNHDLAPLVLGGIMLGIVGILLFSSFGTVLSSLYLSTDMDPIMSAPISRRAVFAVKILSALGLNYAIVAFTAVPAVIAFGVGLDYGPLYYLLAVPAILGVPLFPEALGAILVLFLARFAPARRLREAIAVVASLFGLSLAFAGQGFRGWAEQLSGSVEVPGELITSLQSVSSLPIPPFLAGRGLAAAGAGNVGEALAGVAGLYVVTFGFFALCIWLANSMYAAGWSRMRSAGAPKGGSQRAARDAARRGLLSRAPASLAVALKDWRIIPRDLRQIVQMLSPLILLPILYFNVVASGGGRLSNALSTVEGIVPTQLDPAGIFTAGTILLACIMLVARIAQVSIGSEGRAWWLIKSAPISRTEILFGKFLAAAIPFAVLSTAMILGASIWQEFSLAGTLYGWFGIELIGLAMVTLAVAVSVRWAKMDWTDPRRMVSSWGALLTIAGFAIIGITVGGLLALPVVVQVLAPDWKLQAWLLGVAGAGAATAAIAWVSLTYGGQQLASVGER